LPSKTIGPKDDGTLNLRALDDSAASAAASRAALMGQRSSARIDASTGSAIPRVARQTRSDCMGLRARIENDNQQHF